MKAKQNHRKGELQFAGMGMRLQKMWGESNQNKF